MSAPALARKAFSTSRLAEFASVPELARQTGQPPANWPLTIIKELVDNSIDAAEEAGVAPNVEVEVKTDGSIVVTDQGPGLAPKVVASLVDYTKRTSSRAIYISPSRGAQGNALQTLIAMPYVLDGESGETVIESRGIAHRIVFTVDPLRQTPRVEHTKGPSAVKNGTRITIGSSERACSLVDDAKGQILSLLCDYAWLNPHLRLSAIGPARASAWSARRPTPSGKNGVRTCRPRRTGTTRGACSA
jgi:DNA topoisomerase VI subunit B